MRVPLHVVEARREKLAALIDRHRYLPVHELCRRLGVSEATARRDLASLASRNKSNAPMAVPLQNLMSDSLHLMSGRPPGREGKPG